ncbi:MAG: prenyltransferase/squalene oxidase repeat-containing protein, partial [Myxococcota bacterium]
AGVLPLSATVLSATVLSATVLSLLAPSSAHAAEADLEAATTFLLESQGAYGSWGVLPPRDTGKVLHALRARGEDPDPDGLQAAWLAGAQPVALDLRLRVWQGLAQLDQTPEEALTLLESAQNPDGGYSFYGAGAPSSLQETVLALQLMYTAGYSDVAQVSAALTFVKGKVQSGGGYGYEDNDPSIAVTVEVIQAYQLWRSVFSLESQISAGVGWLATQQQSDGTFGTGPHKTLDTAMSLSVSGGESGLSISAWSLGAATLASSQEPAGSSPCAGSWDCEPYTTAWSLLALEKVKPDLVVESLGFTTSGPVLESSSVTVQAVVRNQGFSASASGALVGVVVKDPTTGTTTAIGQALLSGIQPGNTQTLTVS